MISYDSALYDFTQTLQGQIMQTGMALAPVPTTPPNRPPLLLVHQGMAESAGWFLVQAIEFEPEPLSVSRLRVRAIWSSERIVVAVLDMMASEQWLMRCGDDYYLAPEGQRLKAQMQERTARMLDRVQAAIQNTDVHRLESLLARIIAHALTSAPLPGAWSLYYSQRRAPDASSPPLHRIFHAFSDVNALRDDAHMAAWRPCGISAFAWEAFYFVHQEQAQNPEALFAQLAYRGYSRQDYAEALRILVERGWLREEGGTFHATEQGHTIYAEVETRTDAYFYAPWNALGEADLADLHRLLTQFDEELKAVQSAAQPA